MLRKIYCPKGAFAKFTYYFVLGKTVLFGKALLSQNLFVPELQRAYVIKEDRALLRRRTDQEQAVTHARVGRIRAFSCLWKLGETRVS